MKVACLWLTQETNLEALAELCLRLSPQIGLRKGQALFIEYGKCHRLYSEKTFLQRLQVILRRQGAAASLGVGEGLIEALLSAKYQTTNKADIPLSALHEVADPLNQDFVLQKYVERMISSFEDLGIRHLQNFIELPLRDLSSRFGSAGLLCHQRLKGDSFSQWPQWKPPEKILERTQFPSFEFYGELEPLLFSLKTQLDRIFQRLFARGRKMQKLKITLQCEHRASFQGRERVFIFDFLFPQSQSKGVLPIVRERLSREFEKSPLTSPLDFLESYVLDSVPSSIGQKNFFHQRDELEEKRNALLEGLLEIHGKDSVFFAELVQDRRPEKSWKKSTRPSPSPVWPKQIPMRPLYLLKPEPVEMDQNHLILRGKKYPIAAFSQEIEKISGAWQEESQTGLRMGFEREYFMLTLADKRRLFVFKTDNDEFYLHGYEG